ncbi:MAG TPA: FAD-dependent oxidoreductase [Segetibacter sp.]|jgi:D-amino-acid oxidase
MNKICVIGSGISGLSTAYRLSEAGYEVQVVASKLPPDTTSNKAAAFWFPYHVRNFARAIYWSQRSYEVFKKMSAIEDTGISMKKLVKVVHNLEDEDLSWLETLPKGCYKELPKNEVPEGFILAYEVYVPLIETQIFLPWLMKKLKEKNVSFETKEIKSLDEISSQFKFIINCTALGSRQLCNDSSIYPIRGQVALVEPNESLPIFLHNQQPFYIVPRKDATIIGGTFEENIDEVATYPETLNRLHQQAISIFSQLKGTTIKGSWAGLRPFRKEIRLEKEADTNIIHNYGHGGSGFTVAWGCAEEVLSIVQNDTK